MFNSKLNRRCLGAQSIFTIHSFTKALSNALISFYTVHYGFLAMNTPTNVFLLSCVVLTITNHLSPSLSLCVGNDDTHVAVSFHSPCPNVSNFTLLIDHAPHSTSSFPLPKSHLVLNAPIFSPSSPILCS